MITNARNATLADLAAILREQDGQKLDIIAPAATLTMRGGMLHVAGAGAEITEEGVTATDGIYRPTALFDEGLAEKLGIPLAYVRRLRTDRVDLYDANANGWLHGRGENGYHEHGFVGPDPRNFLVRAFTGGDGEGVARAFLSDRFGMIDNFDVLTATLDGIRRSGANVEVTSCDLTERRMYVKVACPEIAVHAPVLMENYRRPWAPGQAPWETRAGLDHGWIPEGERPVVFAGFVLSNSEVGCGAFTIAPHVTFLACHNGLTIGTDALRRVHVGGQLDEGVVKWSHDTHQKSLALVTAMATDAVRTFLSTEYVQAKVSELETRAGVPIVDTVATIERVGKTLAFSKEETASVLDHFIRGGQATAGGVLNAVTSYAQEVRDADRAHELEAKGVEAMELAVRA